MSKRTIVGGNEDVGVSVGMSVIVGYPVGANAGGGLPVSPSLGANDPDADPVDEVTLATLSSEGLPVGLLAIIVVGCLVGGAFGRGSDVGDGADEDATSAVGRAGRDPAPVAAASGADAAGAADASAAGAMTPPSPQTSAETHTSFSAQNQSSPMSMYSL